MNLNKYGCFLIVALINLFILSNNKVEAAWYYEIVDDAVYDSTYRLERKTSIAIDSDNNPHISYWDKINEKLKYAYYDGTWHVEIIDNFIMDCFSVACESQISLALDSNNSWGVFYG